VIEIDEILKSPDATFKDLAVWHRLDALIEALPENERLRQWNHVAQELEARRIPNGHPHFRLGILHLISDSDETTGIQHLQKAYEQDQLFADSTPPQRKAAYRVLGLVKDFLADLRTKKKKSKWQMDQLQPPHRRVLITTLLAVYDESTKHLLDAPLLTYKAFFSLLSDQDLTRFAAQNYYCAHGLLEMVMVKSGQAFLSNNEYALSRALVGLYGGVLEAILADKLGNRGQGTLGEMINEAHKAGFLNLGTGLCALATVVLYFRNHVHANKDIVRKDYFIDINVAKSLKAATDWVIVELIKQKTAGP
jgi:hypothetical protein